jgi:AcrR family transcriptional regulator
MPKVLPEYLETRRREILDASAACFARKGFHQSTMQDICDEADLSPGAVYRYFRSKEDIIEAMCERNMVEDAETIHAAVATQSVQDAFNELTRIFLLGVSDHEGCALMLQLVAEAPRNEAILESVRRSRLAVRASLSDFIRRGQQRNEFNPALDADAVAQVMCSLYVGLIVQLQTEPDLDLMAYARVTRSLFDGTFAGQGQAASSPAFVH